MKKTILQTLCLALTMSFLFTRTSFAASTVTVTYDGHRTLTFNPDGSGQYCSNQYFLFILPNPDTTGGHTVWRTTTALPYSLDLTTTSLTPGSSYTASIECADADQGNQLTFTYSPTAMMPTAAPTVHLTAVPTALPTTTPSNKPTTPIGKHANFTLLQAVSSFFSNVAHTLHSLIKFL